MGTTSFFFPSCLLSTVPPEVFNARGVDCIATLMRDVDPVQPPLVACLLACLLSFLLVCKRELTPQTVSKARREPAENSTQTRVFPCSTHFPSVIRRVVFILAGPIQYRLRMKLKEIDRTAMQAWSPAQQHPIYLAAGTSAQQLDATFSTNAALEIFELDLADTTLDMKSCGTFSSSHRYHKLVWGPHGMSSEEHPCGVLIAGGENGNVILYDAAKIIAGDSDVVIAQNDKHTGPVRALDVNSFQANLVVSGGNESEIYIWDLNNFDSPMTPGPKSQPLEDISSVAWNRQVQHILASASPSGRASVWDLRKNEPIIKVSDHSNRMHCSGLAWNPEVATQLVLASEDDRMPVIQMWDLRFASSPLKVLENHTRGVLAIAWSLADPELLLSCGKDNRILCWNPNSGEVLYELPTSTQWCFDIQWCPRNPAVLSAAAFDGHVSVYSIMGGSCDGQRQKQADQLTSSFGNLDPFGTGQTLPPLQLRQPAVQQSTVMPLKKPPKWIRRPVGASFAFGGKLVTFENVIVQPQQQQQQQLVPHHVYVSQVVTETDFLERSNQLQTAVQAGNFFNFCQSKVEAAQTEFERNIWSFLKINFEVDPRNKYLELLGYKKEELVKKIAAALEKDAIVDGKAEESVCEAEQAMDSVEGSPVAEEQTQGETEHPVDADLQEQASEAKETLNISVSGDVDGLITQALLTGDFEGAVDLCLHDNRMADAIILAIAGGQELLTKTQEKYFAKTQSKITRLITAVVTKDWKEIVQSCDLQNWREALAAVLTYARPDEFAALCGDLGTRLERDGDLSLQAQACLCYICAGNVEKLVACWTKAQDGNSPLSLQDLVEKVVILRKAVEMTQGVSSNAVGALLAEKMSHYASLLAAQGSLSTAMAYLPSNTDQTNIVHLRDRLYRAQAEQAPGTQVPYERQQATKGRASAKQAHPPGQMPQHQPQAQTQQYYPQVEPPPPGFIMQGPANPVAVSAAPGYMYGQPSARQQYLQRPQNGWNDPPSLSRVPKKKKLPDHYTPPAPITAPIMNPLGDPQAQQSSPPPTFQPHQHPAGQPGLQPSFPGIQQPLPQSALQPSAPKLSAEGPPGAPIGDVSQPFQSIPAEKITKKPIPDEHLVLKTAFEGLIQKCMNAATDPQTRRKLDDANKRLESLYDKLRDQTLSPTIVNGLHNIARSIEARNYMEGLNMHTHIVGNSNFSETSAFMPVLKVVLTQANKLGV
ncbi:protein transport protein Sec31A-like isoform X10 [Acipenser ruthenus]|uniref:protein transport protein Sec31A-like isoform X10 n=1 Tax=Acipenser ruthenus TaxID=7906 RepID=UPI0027409BDB|nr:protein transport protein Sec31A-like isoform X10 [Acipenser ruthenus]